MLAYSIVVMVTILPGLGFPNTVVIPYFLFVPGYSLTILLKQNERLLDLLFYSLIWSIVLVGSVFSVESLFAGLASLPLTAVVPAVTICVMGFDYYHRF